jgi:hypothetical protein
MNLSHRLLTLFASTALLCGLLFPVGAQEPAKPAPQAAPAAPAAQPTQAELDAAVIAQQKPSYPLSICPVSGEPLGSMGDPLDLVANGRLVRVCCKGCTRAVTTNPADAIAKIDAAVIAAQKPTYPLNTCPISGQELGEKAQDVVHGTRLVRLCCEECKVAFAKDPAPTMAKIDAALIEAQRPTYPLTTCFISGEPLDVNGTPQAFLYGTELVQVCCGGCKRAFNKNPEASMLKLREQLAAARAKAAPAAGEKPAETPKDAPAKRGGAFFGV